MGTVSEIRNTVLPKELYDLVFGFAVGDFVGITITTVDNCGQFKQYSFGKVPDGISAVSRNRGQADQAIVIPFATKA